MFLWPKRTHSAATCYCQPPQQQHPAAPGRAHPPPGDICSQKRGVLAERGVLRPATEMPRSPPWGCAGLSIKIILSTETSERSQRADAAAGDRPRADSARSPRCWGFTPLQQEGSAVSTQDLGNGAPPAIPRAKHPPAPPPSHHPRGQHRYGTKPAQSQTCFCLRGSPTLLVFPRDCPDLRKLNLDP